MRSARASAAAITSIAGLLLALAAAGQTPSQATPSAEPALAKMVKTEQAFAARSLAVGWKQSFLEYFADDAVGFDGGRTASARALVTQQPDPPKELKLVWEPRYGDIAMSGDLGYLTGPVQSVNPTRNNGQPRYSNYLSVWKRQADGSFKVVMDAGVTTPDAVAFPPGFTQPRRSTPRTANAQQAALIKSLRDTDAALTNLARASQADAYRGHLADGARMHRTGLMPLVGQDAIVQWLRSQLPYASGASLFADTSTAGDLGYTYGRYATPGAMPEHGFYVRIWTRGTDGVWRVAVDVLQPQ